jgi:hypothetical protein
MGDDITIGVTEIVNNIEVTAQPNDQIVDISVIDNTDEVTLNITPTVIEINVNKGSSFAKWGDILGTLSDQEDLQDALDLKADLVDGKVPSSQLPSYVDDVIEVANYAALPVTGESGKIYITIDNNHIFRWTGSIYVEITDNTAVWGAITGTLSSQTDLVNALNLRVPYTGATGNVNLGEYGLTSGYLKLDTTPTSTPTTIGTIFWDAANRTAALIDGDGDTTLQIGQEQRILVHNNTGSTLTDGQVVYVTGSTGNLPSVSLADATSETTSAATIGVVTESIANGADGFITISGIVNGLNTLAFDEGDLLWLSTTAGAFTTTKPASPAHLVLIGYVIKKAGGNGSILVKIQNTQELSESSDVLFTSLANNDILTYESSSSLWKNKSISTILGYTPANDSNVVHKTGDETISGTKTLDNTLNLLGGANIDDAFGIYWKNNVGAVETALAGIGQSSGALNFFTGSSLVTPKLSLSSAGAATFSSSVTASSIIKSGGTSSQFLKADGSVDSTSYQPLLTNPITGTGTTNYLPKFTGSTALGNSLIFDNGTNIGIGTASPSYKLDVAGVGRFLGTIPLTLERSGSTKYTFSLGASDDFYINNVNIGSTPLTILSSGNVGIGESSPSEKLTIASGNIKLNSFQSSANDYRYIGTEYASGNGNNKAEIRFAIDGADTFTRLQFHTANGAGNIGERMRITSSGDVGIGTTSPSAKLDVNGIFRSIVTSISSTGEISAKILGYPTSPFGLIFRSYSSGATSIQSQREANNSEFFSLSLQPNGGNVGIGTTSPVQKLHVEGLSYFGSDMFLAQNGGIFFDGNSSYGSGIFGRNFGDDLAMNAGGLERMRITSGGDVFIGATSAANVEKLGVTYNSQDRLGFVLNDTYTGSGVAQIAIQFRRNGSAIGSITTTTTTTSYNITSDYRLKQDFKPFNGLDLVSKIKVYDYQWKADNSRMNGVIAHELQDVVPYAVTGEKDAEEMQSVDYSKLVPILVQAIQELKAEIEILKNK